MTGGPLALRWMTSFLDVPSAVADRSVAYWQAVTSYDPSPRRGLAEEFLTLLPPTGDAYLKVQATSNQTPGLHLDLHADDVPALVERTERLGATVVRDQGSYVVLASPGSFVFCVVAHRVSGLVPPPTGEPGRRSRVDQVCLDIPAAAYDREAQFWTDLTGWTRDRGEADEFEHLVRPPGMPLRILLQRLDESDGSVTAHLDLASDDRTAEVARHRSLGGRQTYDGRGWTTMQDPSGTTYCITDRSPDRS